MSTKMPWFRMYTDFLTDPKMISLAFEDQRHFVGILALKSDGAIDDIADGDLLNRIVAQRLWIDHGVIRDVKKRLREAGLIDSDWQPVAWDKRQFVSDRDSTAAERKRRERAAKAEKADKQDVTDVSRVTNRDSHEDVTRLDTDTDTEEEVAKATTPASLPDCPHNEIIDLFAQTLPTLAQPRKSLWRTGANAPALKARWRWLMTAKHESGKRAGQRLATTREEGIAWFDKYFVYVGESDFLTGKTGKWACDLGWLVNQKNFEKVLAGNFENKAAS